MANNNESNFFQKLTRIFRSGPAIRRKIRGLDVNKPVTSSTKLGGIGFNGGNGFKATSSPFSVLGSYGILDRENRFIEFAEMEYQPEISTALDLFADESCSGDEDGNCFHIISDNPDIQRALEELFYEVANINFELRRWVRNLVKFGDAYLSVEVEPDVGVTSVTPIHVSDVDREEEYDPEDPYAVRFKLKNHGSGKILENWQVIHFRIVSNDLFLPYGTSFLEAARKVWRQLIMMEDAMLVYRLVRSPERRVFYIDVSGLNPNDIPNYMEQVKQAIRTNVSTDRMTGRTDQRFNPIDVLEDYFLPTKANSQTKIETLAGGQHVSAVEDVEYMQKKLTATLKVPRAYLGYDDSLSSKATLSQEDVRFSRTIQGIQKVVIAEMNQLAILHLFAKGFEGEDLKNFQLKLSNPSTIALQQKLNLLSMQFDIAAKAKESELVDTEWIQKEILKFRMDTILKIQQGQEKDALRKKILENLEPPKPSGENTGADALVDPFDPTGYGVPDSGMAGNNQPLSSGGPLAQPIPVPSLGRGGASNKNNAPIKANPTPNLDKAQRRFDQTRRTEPTTLGLGDDRNMLTDPNQDPFDMNFLNRAKKEAIEKSLRNSGMLVGISKDMERKLKKFQSFAERLKRPLELEIINESKDSDIVDIIEHELGSKEI